jgi:hypothetical protein
MLHTSECVGLICELWTCIVVRFMHATKHITALRMVNHCRRVCTALGRHLCDSRLAIACHLMDQKQGGWDCCSCILELSPLEVQHARQLAWTGVHSRPSPL